MYAWQFAKLQHAAGQGGWTRFVSMQNQYNLLRRQDEPELMAMCADTGVGLVPYSPQGKGRLAPRKALQQPRAVLVLTELVSVPAARWVRLSSEATAASWTGVRIVSVFSPCPLTGWRRRDQLGRSPVSL